MYVWLTSLLVWLAMLVTAVVGGAVRDKLLAPQLGEHRARQIETLAIAGLFAAGIAYYVTRIGMSPRQAIVLGTGWCLLTLAFETFLGRVVSKQSWTAVAANYNLAEGRLWPIVLMVLLVMPYVAAHWGHVRE